MKGKKEDKNLRDLFRHKLENVEITPGASVKTGLMRKLGRKEFLRFNPGRFNIYYFGGIVAAAVAVALLLVLSGSDDDKKSLLQPAPSSEITIEDLTDTLIISEEEQSLQSTGAGETTGKISAGQVVDKPESKSSSGITNVQPDEKTTFRQKDGINRSDVDGSISKGSILSDTGRYRNNVQSNLIRKDALFAPSVTSGCIPLKVRFKSNSISSASFNWSFGDGGNSNEKDSEWIFDNDGEYKVTLNVLHPDGLKEIYSAVITAHPLPVAHFEVYPEDAVIPDDEIQLINYSANAVRFRWEFGDGTASDLFEPRHKYEKAGNYTIRLTVYSEFGCSDSHVLVNAFSGSDNFIEFPNAFIPNPGGPTGGYYSFTSDEAARIFHPVFSGVSDYQLRIFSKRGILIFESNDINIGWDGYLNGQRCDPGVYIWKVRGNFRNGEPFTKMGDLTLLKDNQ